jgi:quercetin dioxygenase-like cupin family protein
MFNTLPNGATKQGERLSAKGGENLKRLEALIMGTKHAPEITYDGGTEGTCLYNGGDAAVQRCFLKAGTKFAPHVHGSTEVAIVLSGTFHSKTAFLTCVTPVAGVIVFPPGVEHSHEAETDCWVIGVLIPSEPGYPHER